MSKSWHTPSFLRRTAVIASVSLDHDGEPQGVMGGFFAIVNALRRQPAPQRTAVTRHRTDTAADVMN